MMSDGERLARAVLVFYSPGYWDATKRALWLALTGSEEATTKTLADLARKVINSHAEDAP
jgi:hypothetical protein